ncbi:hypothetical protein FPE01S_02_01970 [Flavihumibacter petaseus NBRC 106054]|uniref:Glycoside hydrolase n=2 Tax=Flavihumibacter TaxID=1004301 RepID=A0A0E9MZX7_9BACT|nr:hypothetical protein FPE01S_02_01970 [Flavihumibacter petaseus NBRC 106054]
MGRAQHREEVPARASGADLVGIDQFGRSFGTISGYKEKKQVGIFYWPWIGQPYASGVYDATKITALPNGQKILYDFKFLNDSISPTGQAHFWGEPLWGYYNSEDEWVIRRQMTMLTMAGVDFIVFDLTNRVTYRKVYERVLATIESLQRQGQTPPRAVFYTHSQSFGTTWQVYEELYQPNLYPDAWYRVNGKPMIIAYTNEEDDIAEAKSRNDTAYRPRPYSEEIKNFFYFKKPQWPFDPTYPDGFPWVEWKFPQPLHGNIMSVTVASHPKVPMSRSITSGWINWGRGWDPDQQKNIAADVDKGTFFQRQWDHALSVDPDTIFVGGWNEWIAYKQPYGDEYMLCDAANREYSRDIEPMRDGYGDAFYVQLIKNVRQYKGLQNKIVPYPVHPINIDGGRQQWEEGGALFRNTDTLAIARDNYGVTQKIHYRQEAPRNNIQEMRVSHDRDNFYFLIQTEKAFQPAAKGQEGLQLLVGNGVPRLTGWHGYRYRIRLNEGNKVAGVYQLDNTGKAKTVGKAAVRINGNTVQLRVPRAALGTGSGSGSIYVKAADGIRLPGDILDYYVTGSALPLGSLSYSYAYGE